MYTWFRSAIWLVPPEQGAGSRQLFPQMLPGSLLPPQRFWGESLGTRLGGTLVLCTGVSTCTFRCSSEVHTWSSKLDDWHYTVDVIICTGHRGVALGVCPHKILCQELVLPQTFMCPHKSVICMRFRPCTWLRIQSVEAKWHSHGQQANSKTSEYPYL